MKILGETISKIYYNELGVHNGFKERDVILEFQSGIFLSLQDLDSNPVLDEAILNSSLLDKKNYELVDSSNLNPKLDSKVIAIVDSPKLYSISLLLENGILLSHAVNEYESSHLICENDDELNAGLILLYSL